MFKRIIRAPAAWVVFVLLAAALFWRLPVDARVQNPQVPADVYIPGVFNGPTPTPHANPTSPPFPGPSQAFSATFDMNPTSPLPFSDPEWDTAVHTRNEETLYKLVPMQAQHGPDCSAPPATHLVDDYEEAVYRCRNHVMTAIDDNNYAAITLTPATLLDFTSEEGIVRFDLSTARTSGRDWIDLWITPYELNLIQPLQEYYPDLSGPPCNAVLIEMGSGNIFVLTVFRNFQQTRYNYGVEGANWWTGYETFLEPSAMRRDTFELRLRQDHVQFCMPDYNFCWIDIDLDTPLSWSSGIVQFSHHSYTAAKACDYDGSCGPNTWHWDNVEIYPAVPFRMLPADRRYVQPGANQVTFAAPAPIGSYLRFSAFGENIEVSFDNGQIWQAASRQQQTINIPAKWGAYWMPVPAGTQTIRFRGDSWVGASWHARSISIWVPEP